ncbi:MAG: hypothetical protein JSS96_03475 [Bacteroidetes bacterium]|nr:hypothetical protein [Bacteroidota bacterium]
MAKKFHTVVILFFLLVVVSFSSFGNGRTVPPLNGYILQDSTMIISQMEMEITPSKAVSFYNKGKFPLKNKFIIRIKALNDYSTGLGLPAVMPPIFFSSVFFSTHYFTLYRSHISAILNSFYLLRGPPASIA